MISAARPDVANLRLIECNPIPAGLPAVVCRLAQEGGGAHEFNLNRVPSTTHRRALNAACLLPDGIGLGFLRSVYYIYPGSVPLIQRRLSSGNEPARETRPTREKF